MQKRLNQTIHLQKSREEVYKRTQAVQENIKKSFDKRTKTNNFQVLGVELDYLVYFVSQHWTPIPSKGRQRRP